MLAVGIKRKKRKMSEMHVQYIAHSGNDLLVVNAARVSFAKESKRFNDKDQKLIPFQLLLQLVSPFLFHV